MAVFYPPHRFLKKLLTPSLKPRRFGLLSSPKWCSFRGGVNKWKKKRTKLKRAYHRAARKRLDARIFGQAVGTALVGLPGMAMVIAKQINSNSDHLQIAQAMMTLGKMVSVSVVVKGLVDTTAGFSAVTGRFSQLATAAHADMTDGWSKRMLNMLDKRDQLRVYRHMVKDGPGQAQQVGADQLLAAPQNLLGLPGRWTIRAANGIGRTTMGSALMSQLRGQYDYIPVKHRLCFKRGERSAGEQAIHQLAELIRKSSRRIIFLDEWPANLDPRNTQAVSDLLDRLCARLTIIEMIPA